MTTPITERRFATTNGQSVVADVAGPEGGKPIVLMHGGGQTRHSWKKALLNFAEAGYRAYSLDARGHGDSDWAKDANYTMTGLGGDLRAVLKEIPSPPVLIGASMGGMTSIYVLGEPANELARGLVLVDVTPRIDFSGAERIGEFMTANLDGFETLEQVADAVSAYNPHRPRPKDISGLKKNLRERNGRWYWHWDPAFIIGARDPAHERDFTELERRAAKITVPTLLVRGAQSDIVGEAEVQHFREIMPHAEYVDVAGAGHMVAGDKNDAFNGAILEFVKRLDAGGAKSRAA
jgi:pimeloyl-ACP methyl ester carboxylesterase